MGDVENGTYWSDVDENGVRTVWDGDTPVEVEKDSMRTYFDAAVPADPRVVLAALDRRLAQGVAGHALAARMRAHRERLLRQIEQEDASG